MKLRDIMTRNVETVSANSDLVEAANIMARHDIGFLPVEDGDIAGVVTDRDIVVRAIAEGRDPRATKVREIVTPGAEVLLEDDEVDEVVKLMQTKQIRRVLVTDGSGAYVGVVSLGDLAAQGHETELSGQALESVCAP